MRLLKKARLAAAILVLGGVGAAVVEHQITRISNPAHVPGTLTV